MDHLEPDTPEFGGGAGEVPVDEFLTQTEGLEDLGSAIRGDGRDPHLGHHLEHALAESLDEIAHRDLGGDLGQRAGPDHRLHGLHGQIGVDRGRAVADQQRDVVHLAHITGLHQHRRQSAGLLAHEMVVDRGHEQQRRDRCMLGVGVPIAEDQESDTRLDGGVDLREDLLQPLLQRFRPPVDLVQPANLDRREPGEVPIGVDVEDLGQFVVVDHRERQQHLPAMRRRGVQQIALRADRTAQGGDDLLTQGVERRVGDLGEQLREVVEQQPRPVGQDRHRRIGAHRPDRLHPGACHGRQDDPQFLLGVPEGLLAACDRRPRVHHVLTLRQFLEVDHARMQPLLVRELGGEFGLDLVVLDDPALNSVDQEHLPRLQTPLAHHRCRIEVEHARLGGQHDQPVGGLPESAGPQTVAVQHRPDDPPIGEGHAGRTVPRLHQRGVVFVEGATRRVHLGVVLPGLRDHHQHRMRKRPATQIQELQHLVETRRVAGRRRADREQPLQVPRDVVAGQEGLARPHPVPVALDGVDLAVVGDESERMRQRPTRERVRREARVHHAQCRGGARVGQVREERLQLRSGEHALVDDRARAQRGEVHARLPLGPLAKDEGEPLEVEFVVARRSGDEDLPETRHRAAGGLAHHGVERRDFPPPQNGESLVGGDGFDRLDRHRGLTGVGGQEGRTDSVATCCRQVEVHCLPEQGVRNLQQDARTVAGVGLTARGTSVLEIAQSGQCVLDDLVRGLTGHRRHEGDTTCVVLERRVVQAVGGDHGHSWSGGLPIGRTLTRSPRDAVGPKRVQHNPCAPHPGVRVPSPAQPHGPIAVHRTLLSLIQASLCWHTDAHDIAGEGLGRSGRRRPGRRTPSDPGSRSAILSGHRETARSKPHRQGDGVACAHQSGCDHQAQGLQEDPEEVQDAQADEAWHVPHHRQDRECRWQLLRAVSEEAAGPRYIGQGQTGPHTLQSGHTADPAGSRTSDAGEQSSGGHPRVDLGDTRVGGLPTPGSCAPSHWPYGTGQRHSRGRCGCHGELRDRRRPHAGH